MLRRKVTRNSRLRVRHRMRRKVKDVQLKSKPTDSYPWAFLLRCVATAADDSKQPHFWLLNQNHRPVRWQRIFMMHSYMPTLASCTMSLSPASKSKSYIRPPLGMVSRSADPLGESALDPRKSARDKSQLLGNISKFAPMRHAPYKVRSSTGIIRKSFLADPVQRNRRRKIGLFYEHSR